MEFLFNEAKYLDNDEDIIEAVKILSNENPNVTIEKIFGDNSDSDLRNKYIVGFEKLFNLLDRLSHAYFSLGTLSLEEIRNFSWYLREITKSSKLLKYCEDNGYGDVVKLSQEI